MPFLVGFSPLPFILFCCTPASSALLFPLLKFKLQMQKTCPPILDKLNSSHKEATALHLLVLFTKSTHHLVHEKQADLRFRTNELWAREHSVGHGGSELYSTRSYIYKIYIYIYWYIFVPATVLTRMEKSGKILPTIASGQLALGIWFCAASPLLNLLILNKNSRAIRNSYITLYRINTWVTMGKSFKANVDCHNSIKWGIWTVRALYLIQSRIRQESSLSL